MMSFLKSPFWEAFGLIAGMIIGSGMFALPYAVSVSGFWPSAASAILALFTVLSLHLAYGEIAANTMGRHRFPGYVKIYLGDFWGRFSKLTQVVFFTAILLVYGVLGGIFIAKVFGGVFASPFWWTIICFAFGSIMFIWSSAKRVGLINFLLTIPLIFAIFVISYFAWRSGSVSNVHFYAKDPFFAYGFFVFSLAGLSIIADAKEVFKEWDVFKSLKRAIIFGTAIPFFLYIFYVVSVLMASGTNVTSESLDGLSLVLGEGVILIGAFVGALAMFTSYLALGYDLKEVYEFDFGISKFAAWALVSFAPLALFLFGFTDFVKLISIAGGVFVALDGIFVILMLKKLRAGIGQHFKFLPFGRFQRGLLFTALIASIVYELVYQIL